MAPVAVVGAGAVGLATAYHLVRRGEEVVVYDAGEPGSGCSFGNAGWIAPGHVVPLPGPQAWEVGRTSLGRAKPPVYLRLPPSPETLSWLYRFARHCTGTAFERGCHALSALSATAIAQLGELQARDPDLVLTGTGLLHLFERPEAARRALAAASVLDRDGIVVPQELLKRQQLLELEPAVGERAHAGFLFPEERCVDPRRFTASLTAAIVEGGGEIRPGSPVTGVGVSGSIVSSVQSGAHSSSVSAVVVAAGAWSGRIARLLGQALPVLVGRGYSLNIRLENRLKVGLHLSDVSVGLAPTQTGARIAGIMEISSPAGQSRSGRRMIAMLRSGAGYVKGWPAPDPLAVAGAWSGMRPITPDGLPLIDRIPHLQNAYVSTGHGMWGIALALPSGAALAQFLTEGRRPRILEPFGLDRM